MATRTLGHGSEHGCFHVLKARLIDAKRLCDDLNDIVFLAARHECRSFGKLGFQILSVTGGHAAGDDKRSASSHIRHTGNFEDGLRLSSVALWINEQVFTTTASADSGSCSIAKPQRVSCDCMRWVSTSFFAQPMVTNATRGLSISNTFSVSTEILSGS